jgi:hypothetical protein
MNIPAAVSSERLLKKLLRMWKTLDIPACMKKQRKNK